MCERVGERLMGGGGGGADLSACKCPISHCELYSAQGAFFPFCVE